LRNKIILSAVIFTLISSLSFGVDRTITGKLLKVVVSGDNGRFLLYGRRAETDQFVPLLFEEQTPAKASTFFKFVMNDTVLPFGIGGSGRQNDLWIEDNKLFYSWSDNSYRILLSFYLAASASNRLSDSLIIELSIVNKTRETTRGSISFCVDTYFGERERKHFILPGDISIDSEYEITRNTIPDYIRSYDNSRAIGVNMLFNRERQVVPDRVFFTNWKAFNESTHTYSVVTGRDFSLSSYSQNDSALIIEYKDQLFQPNTQQDYRFIISLETEMPIIRDQQQTTVEQNTETQNQTTVTTQVQQNTVVNTTTNTQQRSFNGMTISDLLRLLDRINSKLNSGAMLTDEDVRLSEEILNELRSRSPQ